MRALRVFSMVLGNTMNSHKLFMDRLSSKMKLHEAYSESDCDVIIVFVPIVSRAGTDIQAALEKLHRHSYKNIILVSLHHTFDPHYIAPDSRHSVHRSDVFAVDCLYHEDQGLLTSRCNDEALKRVIKHLGGEKSSNQVSEPSWLSGVDNTELISWIFTVLSIFLVYLVLPEGYSFFTLLIFEIFLLIIMAVTLNYYNLIKRTLWIFISINILFFILILVIQSLKTEKQDLQK
ncbi:hypothetical protein PHYPO_G00144540 [Pangasianodon hypophthalmus]|uniref:Uncharacterized protein n=2 Tax=Pangasianodon hypophthalmus TaxID=310915 RepID=A0A5N5K5V4_PANHP|nr:hypothetical protein PHYPO_G00144540 [Pangasianodon hypophthalmus]